MAVSSGFFNSVNHDRLYDAEQISAIFDGIINDGVFESVGDAFSVVPNEDLVDSIIVGTGRAWFDHTWILNDSQYSITLSAPSTIYQRIDAVVIDVDRRDSVRAATLKVVEGSPASEATKPALINEELHKQYPVAYVTVYPGNSEIVSASHIQRSVGTNECPLVTGPLEVINDDAFFAQMDASFNEFKTSTENEWDQWFEDTKASIAEIISGKINLSNTVDNVTIEWYNNSKIRVKDQGITRSKLSSDVLSAIGILDTSDWNFDQYYSHIKLLTSSAEQIAFLSNIKLFNPTKLLPSWTGNQIKQFFDALLSQEAKEYLWDDMPWRTLSMSNFRYFTEQFGSSHYADMVGKTISLDMGDSFGLHDFRVIGVNHDDLVSGGKALLTFQSTDIIEKHTFDSFVTTDEDGISSVSTSSLGKYYESLYDSFDADTKSMIKEVVKKEKYKGPSTSYNNVRSINTKIWMITYLEAGLAYQQLPASGIYTSRDMLSDSCYDYYSGMDSNYGGSLGFEDPRLIFKYAGTASKWFVRPVSLAQINSASDPRIWFRFVQMGTTGAMDQTLIGGYANQNYFDAYPGQKVSNCPIIPCFCV